MATYIGYMEKKDVYFNFKPLCEFEDNELILLSSEDRRKLLPYSEKENINFSYNFNFPDQYRFMDEHFFAGQLVVFDFDLSDLQDNITRGERNATGYKVITVDIWETGKIRYLKDLGISLLLSKDNLKDNFYSEKLVEIAGSGLHRGVNVVVELDNNLIAGPYEVGLREIDKVLYILPQIKENKYTISGYLKSDCVIETLDCSDGGYWAQDYIWSLVWAKQDAVLQYQDLIRDTELLNSFKESLPDDYIKNGYLNVSDVDKFLQQFETSILIGSPLPEEIRTNRLNRLAEIITAERDLDKTLLFIAETLGESLSDLIIKYQDSPRIDELIKAIIDRRPEFIERIQNSRIIKEQILTQQQELDQLQYEKEQAQIALSNLRESSESAEKSILEQKTKELLEMEDEYKSAKEKLDIITHRLKLSESIESMQSEKDNLNQQIADIETHKRFLSESTQKLEIDFSSIISNHHDRMANIAFDRFMSNRMLRAAAEWESESVEKQYQNAVEIINAIEYLEKDPETLIAHLCRLIQIARPQYTRNDIVNVLICVTQGFLTVFSGEPGCGKTSMCNLMAEALGLNKFNEYAQVDIERIENLSRYISVSVERGWTSKRDFIGYYNPLSKTFDKSNRRVFDGLKILDIENKTQSSKYPFVILLDEANLSPMEYYWADFMNICDDLGNHSQINLGEEFSFSIPPTLHFVATINNDHTTETLSPRLIDRAWVITLPQSISVEPCAEIPENLVEIISWDSICNTFLPDKEASMTKEVQQIYETKIIPHLRKEHISISPRTDIAIKRYWSVAYRLFEEDRVANRPPSIVALDYAMAQKVLPKIIGNGEEFAKWLEDFRSLCSSNNLIYSAGLLKDMISKGQMGYYQFFN